jgi:hypothetical protein
VDISENELSHSKIKLSIDPINLFDGTTGTVNRCFVGPSQPIASPKRNVAIREMWKQYMNFSANEMI